MPKAKSKNKLEGCEVCFYAPHCQTIISELMTCKVCERQAHVYCYGPHLQNKQLICDSCQYQAKNPECMICHNGGLMKRTREGNYAHPLCLLFCNSAVTIDFKTLSFHYQASKRKIKSQKCEICSKFSFLSDLVPCFENRCMKSAHLYCIMKEHHQNSEETGRWVQELKIYAPGSVNFLQSFAAQLQKIIKLQSFMVHKEIFGNKKLQEESPLIYCYCRQHNHNITNCFCESLQDYDSKVDWVFCDSCNKWYHFECEKIKETDLSDKYTCRQCHTWHEIIKSNGQPVLKVYPSLHLYDLVYTQYWCEAQNYRVPEQIKGLLARLPLLCSLKYFNEALKTKQMCTKIVKSINFMHVKKNVVDRNGKKKDLSKNLAKLDKIMSDVIWKMDFLTGTDPIDTIAGFKNGKYSVEEILGFFQKYEKKYVDGLTILRPAIKELFKLNNIIKNEEDEEGNPEDDDLGEAMEIVKSCLSELKTKKSSPRIKYIEFCKKVDSHEYLKELLKDFLQQNKRFQDTLGPIFIFDDQQDMWQHSHIQACFKVFSKYISENSHHQFAIKWIKSIINPCSNRVKTQNVILIRQISTFQPDNSVQLSKNYGLDILNKFQHEISFEHLNIISHHQLIENRLTQILKVKHIQKFLKQLQLTRTSLTKLSTLYISMKQILKISRTITQTFQSYLKLYQSASKLVTSINQIHLEDGQIINVDFMHFIKILRIDRENIHRFCLFFLEVSQFTFYGLQDKFQNVVKDKAYEFLGLISSRSMIFQCEAEFKAAKALVFRYNAKFNKILDLIGKNNELLQMLKDVSIKSLDQINFLDSNINKLNQAKQFCQDSGLEFRINKIEYMIKIFQCKKEAMFYCPMDITTSKSKFKKPQTVDFYILKKILYKMKLLKYPESDELFLYISSLYQQKIGYYNMLSLIISNYNSLLENKAVDIPEPRLTKEDVLLLIQSNRNHYITIHPEEDEIFIILDIFNETLESIKRIVQRPSNYSIQEIEAMREKISKFPFEFKDQENYKKLIKLCGEAKKKDDQVEIIEVPEKRVSLDETSAKAQLSNKNMSRIMSLWCEIKAKPRTISLQQVECRFKQTMKMDQESAQSLCISSLIEGSRLMLRDHSTIISKFIKNQPYSETERNTIKNLTSSYENQPIKIEIIETICNQFRIFEKYAQSHLKDSTPFSNELYSQSINSNSSKKSNQDVKIIGSIQKNKKIKLVLRK